MSGYVGNLSTEQEEKLKRFRNSVRDVLRPHHDDQFLLRWLRARNFNVNAAETMLRNSLAWRGAIGADSLLTDYKPPEILRKYVSSRHVGYDKEGYPVWLTIDGGMDIKGLLHSSKQSEVLKYMLMIKELAVNEAKKQAEKLGKPIDKHSAIHDMDGFPLSILMWKPTIELFLEFVKILEANYPETLKTLYVINAPAFFPYIYSIMKLFLSEETSKKLKIFPKDDSWKEALLKDIDPSELPKHWGGTKIDPDGDPKCPSIICLGGKIPTSYYLCDRLSSNKNSKTVIIGRRMTYETELSITKPGSVIRWEFKIERDYDIGFGIFRQERCSAAENGFNDGESEVAVLPMQRIASYIVPESGTVTCDLPGKYVLKFDNSFSWYREKKITFSFGAILPNTSP